MNAINHSDSSPKTLQSFAFQIQENLAPKSVSALLLVLELEPANAHVERTRKPGPGFAFSQNSGRAFLFRSNV